MFSAHDGHFVGGHKFGGEIVSVTSAIDSQLFFVGVEKPSACGGEIYVFNPAMSGSGDEKVSHVRPPYYKSLVWGLNQTGAVKNSAPDVNCLH